ncbi:MAG TPA: SDR family NAD(P)-dependent oxidoreductase [Acidimicrobiales bacterium]|nr:SDR family NAD(P)-dependent oxidoreductase [Acidimicrobiales bacterium]
MSSWQGRRALVTGAEGFIGSHLVEQLLSEGATVRALVHYNPFGRWTWLQEHSSDVEIVAGDVRDGDRVARAIEGTEVVFHLAALVGIPYSYEAPDSYVQTNVVGTYNVLTGARRAGVDRMVHTSTSEVYGTARRVPIDESHPLQPQSPYSASKIGADMLALSFHHSFGLPVSVMRPFNTYGPRQSSRAVIPSILGQLLAGAEQVRIGATSPTRDFNFVTDTVRGFLAVAASDRAVGEVVNIGSGREISVGDLVDLLVQISGRSATVVTDTERLRPGGSEVERLLCDNARAKEWTGWRPEVTLEEGLRKTAEWVADNLSSVRTTSYHV